MTSLSRIHGKQTEEQQTVVDPILISVLDIGIDTGGERSACSCKICANASFWVCVHMKMLFP